MICFEGSQTCMILLTTSDNTIAFRPLLEKIIGHTVKREWDGYMAEGIAESRKH